MLQKAHHFGRKKGKELASGDNFLANGRIRTCTQVA